MTATGSWEMPLRTKLLARAVQRWRGGISTLTPDEIARSRALFTPPRPPYTWVTGSVPRSVRVGDLSFTARDGARLAVHTYRRRDAEGDTLPALLWFHGGGWVLGNTRGYDPICAWLAATCRVAVLNVGYRLAPEHRAPQAAHDCIDAARWVASMGPADGIRPTGIGLAGDSAGGNLAAVAAHVLRDEAVDVGYQALLYPAVDATMSSPSVAQHAQAPILTRPDMDAFLAHYLGDAEDALDRRDPLVSPLHARDHERIPPTLVQTADLDPLRDEGRRYADVLRRAGTMVRHTNYPRVPHGFMSFPGATRAGAAARAELADWVSAHAHRPTVG
ncbi:MAG: alpha/beta hydrolase [Terrabacter sp.]